MSENAILNLVLQKRGDDMILSLVFILLGVVLFGYSFLRYYYLWKRGRMPIVIYYVVQIFLLGNLFVCAFFSHKVTNDILFFVMQALACVHTSIMLITPLFSMIRGGVRMIGARRTKTNAFFRFFNHPSKVNYIVLVLTACFGVALFCHAKIMRVETTSVTIDDKELEESYVIASVSNLHIGSQMTRYEIRNMTDRLLDANADAIVLGGDVLDANASDSIRQYTYKQWKRLTAATDVYLVAGAEETKWEEKEYDKVSALGVRVLQDESVFLQEGVQMIGCRDVSDGKRKNVRYTSSLLDKEKPTVVLSYQPLSELERQQVDYDVMISSRGEGYWFFPKTITVTTISGKRR